MGEVLFIDLESDRHSPQELRTVAETLVRRRLLAVPGVSQVIATGGDQKQYEVVLDPARLASHAVTLDDVERALTAANRNATAGFQVAEGQEYLIRGVGRLTDTDAIAAVAVRTTGAVPVLVRDLGLVREGAAIKRGEGSHNAKPAVILGIQKQPNVNTLDLTAQIEATLDDLQRALPAGMQIHRDLFRQADFIEQALRNLFTALLEGAGLVILVVLLFLMNGRAALITLLALPLSLVAAAVALDRFGLTINSMSLGGLAIAIGELVDDAIIDVENVVRRLRQNAQRPEAERRSVLEVVYRASTEIRTSVVFATVIVVLVFLPLFVLGSVEGPAAAAPWLRLCRRPVGVPARGAHGDAGAVRLAAPVIEADSLGHRAGVDALAEGRVRAAGCCAPFTTGAPSWRPPWCCWWRPWSASSSMGRSFLPEFNEGALTVSAVTIPGTSLADSNALGNALERLLLSVPEVSSTARRTGRAELDEHVQGVESAEIDVRLHAVRARPRRRARGDPAEGVAAPRHQRHGRAADLAPHRPHAVGHAREHRGEDLRRRPPAAAGAGAAGAGRNGPRARRRGPVRGGASRHSDAAREGRRRGGLTLRPRDRRGHRGAADGSRRADRWARCSKARSPFRWSCGTSSATTRR